MNKLVRFGWDAVVQVEDSKSMNPYIPKGYHIVEDTDGERLVKNQIGQPICDYCNNPVASGKHVHERCVEKFDEREEEADRDSGV